MQTYRNPIARDGDFADPFVLRFNGRYYLYCTNPDIRCWSSTDLVDWREEGPTIAPGTFGDLVPFAPEVSYHDGVFYLYTSPSGIGHHVLRADAPTGPFTLISGNLGHAIDGHVFTDDDGRRYFYWAGDEGIWGCEMSSPTEFGEPVLTGASMHGWTEGPFVTKRGSRYHLTLTGNHYLSAGYRINAAVSDHPLHGYRDSPLNPILVSTAPGTLGLGHSSSVLGPDLVSTWLVYHNLNPDQSRDLNLDRQAFNGDLLQILGPSQLAARPALPDHRTRWGEREAGRWQTARGALIEAAGSAELSGPGHTAWAGLTLPGCFTSEHNLSAHGAGSYGLDATTPGGDGWVVQVEPDLNRVRALGRTGQNEVVLATADLPDGYRHDAIHCFRLVYSEERVSLHLDSRHQFDFPWPASAAGGLRPGYHVASGSLTIGYTALTAATELSATNAAARPVPGSFAVPLAADRENAGTADVWHTHCRQGPGETLSCPLLVSEPGEYDLHLLGDFAAGTRLTIRAGGVTTGLVVEEASGTIVTRLQLGGGLRTLDLVSPNAALPIRRITLARPPAAAPSAAPTDLTVTGTGKLATPADQLERDITAIVRVSFESPGGHADLLISPHQLAEGGEGDDPELGINFLLGYSLQLHPDRVVLARHAYDEQILAQTETAIDPGLHSITVSRRGACLTAIVDDGPPLTHVDRWPYCEASIGVRASGASITLEQVLPGRGR